MKVYMKTPFLIHLNNVCHDLEEYETALACMIAVSKARNFLQILSFTLVSINGRTLRVLQMSMRETYDVF